MVDFAISYEQGNQINTVKISLPFLNLMKCSQTKRHADTMSDFKIDTWKISKFFILSKFVAAQEFYL